MMFLKKPGSNYITIVAWGFTLSFILITFLPRSVDNVMFMDGVTYASIARNMSIGIGSFWRPVFADSFWLPYDNNEFFSGHPPLQFGMQSLLFRIMGDSTAVENIYNLLILIFSIILITAIWKTLFENTPDLKKYSWMPVLSWYAMITVWYSIPNNFLDSTMAVFCLLSCYFQLLFFKNNRAGKNYFWMILAGISILAAFLSKGPVGLFPLAIPVIFCICFEFKKVKTAIVATAFMAGTFAIGFLTILSYEPACDFLETYFQGQVVQALLQKREKTGTGWTAHFILVFELARNVYPHLLVVLVIRLAAYFFQIKIKMTRAVRETSLFTFLIACSGIVPMLVSIKQYPHYLLPALPFVALFFASILAEQVGVIISMRKSHFITATLFLCAGCWILTASKMIDSKSSVMAANALKLKKMVKRSSTIGICPELYQNADIHANLQRYHLLSLTTDTNSTRYVLADSTCLPDFNSKTDSIIPLEGKFSLVIKDVQHIGQRQRH
ncbi:ArnT family glycosyltransferase [Dyadobacter aurulentus]|uniref:ArnT family glycosyltransferase n=1 Tax=Dyadobacter sp. UC 10 TaxID=2605428 RepID=UPI0011F31197|nr:glycosyltransferase family 39 protein [Dyadobacter sp. UC 10]KAA0990652.1 hypothetical protein FXO21_11070 [Dyadobacter sp. UC 10]